MQSFTPPTAAAGPIRAVSVDPEQVAVSAFPATAEPPRQSHCRLALGQQLRRPRSRQRPSRSACQRDDGAFTVDSSLQHNQSTLSQEPLCSCMVRPGHLFRRHVDAVRQLGDLRVGALGCVHAHQLACRSALGEEDRARRRPLPREPTGAAPHHRRLSRRVPPTQSPARRATHARASPLSVVSSLPPGVVFSHDARFSTTRR